MSISEKAIEAAAAVIAEASMTGSIIEKPNLPTPCWMGLARAALEAALPLHQHSDTVEQARAIQAKQVMPLIGPLLDAWDDLMNDTRGAWREECPVLCSYLDKLNTAMEVDHAAAPPAPLHEDRCAVERLRAALLPFVQYADLNDLREREPDDAIEVPIRDLIAAERAYHAAAPPAPQAAPNGLENLKAILADQPYRNSALSVIEIETILENGGGFMPDEAVSWFRSARGNLAAAPPAPVARSVPGERTRSETGGSVISAAQRDP